MRRISASRHRKPSVNTSGTGDERAVTEHGLAERSPADRRSSVCHPARATAGNDAMQMRVKLEILPPSVKHCEEADLAPRCFGSAAMVFSVSDVPGRGCRRPLPCSDRQCWQSLLAASDDVKILRARSSLVGLQPLSTASIDILDNAYFDTAIRDALMTALITLLDMTAKRSGAAEFDRGHDAALRCAQLRVMLRTIGAAVAAEHIRHFRPRPGHQPRGSEGLGWGGRRYGGTGRGSSSRGSPSRIPCW